LALLTNSFNIKQGGGDINKREKMGSSFGI